MKTMMKWTNNLLYILSDKITENMDHDAQMDEDTKDYVINAFVAVTSYLIKLDCHTIGKYESETEQISVIQAIVDYKYWMLCPRLLKLKGVFSETPYGSKFEKVSDHTGSHSGTSRAAGENSPITSAPINSAPGESDNWNISNPNVKSGSQYDNAFTNNLEESHTNTDPESYIKSLKFNTIEWNIYVIIRDMLYSITEEFCTAY